MYSVTWSDHFPLVVNCDLSLITPKMLHNDIKVSNRAVWGERSPQQLRSYQVECHKRLRVIDFSHELSSCCDKMCGDLSHRLVIDMLYNSVVRALTEAASVGRGGVSVRRNREIESWAGINM